MANKNKKAVIRYGLQKRAEELKSLMEQRAEFVEELKGLADTAELEKRAMTKEENEKFDEIEQEIKNIDATIERLERARNIPEKKEEKEDKVTEEPTELEKRAFEAYVRGEVLQERADVNLTTGDNGAVIPSSIANTIIKKVHDICPIYQMAKK